MRELTGRRAARACPCACTASSSAALSTCSSTANARASGRARRPVRRRGAPVPAAADRVQSATTRSRILSPLVLLEQRRARLLPLAHVRAQPLARAVPSSATVAEVGLLQDVVVAEDGQLVAAIVDERASCRSTRALRFAPSAALPPDPLVSPASWRSGTQPSPRVCAPAPAMPCASGATGSSWRSSASSARRATSSTSWSTSRCSTARNLHYRLAATGSFLVAVTNNYLWNRLWTFRHDRGHFGYQGLRFLVVSVIVYVGNLAILTLLVELGLGQDRRAGDCDRSRDTGELHRQQALVVPETALRLILCGCRGRARGSGLVAPIRLGRESTT